MPSNVLLCLINSPKSRDIQFTVMYDNRKLQILRSEKLQPANVSLAFCLKIEWSIFCQSTNRCSSSIKYHNTEQSKSAEKHDSIHTGNLFTTKMFISIHLKQLQDIERFTEECSTQKWFMKQPNCPLNPSLGVTLDPISESEQNQLTVDKPQRGGRERRRGSKEKKEGRKERICTAHGGKQR